MTDAPTADALPDDAPPDDAPADDAPPASARRWPPIAVGALVAAAWLVAIGWRVRRSFELVFTPPDGLRVCPAIMPAPPECSPEWHLSIAATGAGAIVLAYGLVILVSLRTRNRTFAVVALAVLMLVGAIGFELVDDWNRYFWSP